MLRKLVTEMGGKKRELAEFLNQPETAGINARGGEIQEDRATPPFCICV